jgi:starch synthase
VFSVYNDDFDELFHEDFIGKLKFEGLSEEQINAFRDRSYKALIKSAIDNSDAIIYGEKKIDPEIDKYIKDNKDLIIPFNEDGYIDAYNDLYDKLLEE